jgi:O-antigen ligase
MRWIAEKPLPWIAGFASLLVGSLYAWFLVAEEPTASKALWALPLMLVAIYLLLFHFRTFFWLIPGLIPISINSTDIGGGVGFSAPVEGFIWLAALALGVKMLYEPLIEKRIFSHPLTWIILIQTFWLFASALLSTQNLISGKLFAARVVYLWVFYFFFFGVFMNVKNIFKFSRNYILLFLPVIAYSTSKLGLHGFSQKYSPAMSEPFYSDHTIYGACISMLLPMAILMWRHRKKLELPNWLRKTALPIVAILAVGVLLSYSRAAWLSLVACAGFYALLRLRVRFLTLLTLLICGVMGFVAFQDEILMRMEANQVKGERDFLKHAQSITDVERDESNKERLNRWSAALQMAKEKPLTGFGPGTYETSYGVYQSSLKMTRISTKQGDRGDAHSEYLTALSEQGIPGLALWLLLILATIATGMRAYYRARSDLDRIAALGLLLGLITYYVHGAVNSFLDIEKANTLFWSSVAALAVLEMRTRQKPQPTPAVTA